MLDRSQIIDTQFIDFVKNHIPNPNETHLSITIDLYKELFSSQLASRLLDLKARSLKEQGLGFYTIGSSGHEGMAAVAAVFDKTDPAFLHYRDGSFYIQRAKQAAASDPIYDMLLSLVASKLDPIAGGRHKVLGSKQLWIPPQTSTIASHLPKALGAALAIEKAKKLNLRLPVPENSVVACSFGDASLNHASALATINACEWWFYQGVSVPMVFICEDNGRGISVPTPRYWIEDLMRGKPCLHYIQADGCDLDDTYQMASQAVAIARTKREPVFLHLKCVRLLGHAGSDVEQQYLAQEEIEANEMRDPLLRSASALLDCGAYTNQAMLDLYESLRQEIAKKAQHALKTPKLSSASEVKESIVPPKIRKAKSTFPNETMRKSIFGSAYDQLNMKRNLSQLINFALTDLMQQYEEIVLLGEDIGKKGGVYRVTAELQERFGSERVIDTLLDETSILGSAIGMSQMGFLPVPEIQFLAYLHNAEDQLRGEAATLSFFSNGQFTNPLVVRIAGLGYQRGFGGHFHNDNSIAVLRDIPGIIIACPSNGSDAVGMLRECIHQAYVNGRVVVFLEPIALYMQKDLMPGDNAWLCDYPKAKEVVTCGEVKVDGRTNDYLIISYGNGYYLSRQAQQVLKEKGISVKVMDLRWLAPLPEDAILKEARKAKHVLIVDECRKTGSISEAIMTLLVESLTKLPKLRRITAHDTFIPLGNAWEYVLPSRDDIIDAILTWRNQANVAEIA